MSDLVPAVSPVMVALPHGCPASCMTNWLKSYGGGKMDAGLDRLLNVVPLEKAAVLKRQGALGGALICASVSCAILAGVVACWDSVKKRSKAAAEMQDGAEKAHYLTARSDESLEKGLLLLRGHGFPNNRVLTEFDPDGKPFFKIEVLADEARFDEIASQYESMITNNSHMGGEEDRK